MGRREDNTLRRQKRQSLVGFLLSLILIFVFLILIRFSVFDSFFRRIYSPAWLVTEKVSDAWQGEFLPATKSKKTLWRENQIYLKALEENIVSSNQLRILQQENEQLRLALNNLAANNIQNATMANVISNENVPWFSSLVINLPDNHSHQIGDLVYAEGNVLIGYLSKIEQNNGVVRLFTGQGEVTRAIVLDSGLFVDLIGRGGVNYEIHLPREIELLEGQILVGVNSNQTQIAVVGETIFDARDPYQTVLAVSPVNPLQLSKVYIVQKN